MRLRLLSACLAVLIVTGCTASAPTSETERPPTPAAGNVTPPKTDAEMIANAMAAAPASVSQGATILAFNEQGEARTLREGTNGWTCIPDNPQSPGVDPMCLDQGGLKWAQAWMSKQPPPTDTMGFGYMLLGGSDASNDDPYATAPPEGHAWVDTGPHVMIFNVGDRFPGYPTTHDNTKVPYVMWANTPYRHLMIPVR